MTDHYSGRRGLGERCGAVAALKKTKPDEALGRGESTYTWHVPHTKQNLGQHLVRFRFCKRLDFLGDAEAWSSS